MSGVEVTVRYAHVVDDLAEAWTFVMSAIDRVGTDEVHLSIDAVIEPSDDENARSITYEVVVEGTTTEPAPVREETP